MVDLLGQIREEIAGRITHDGGQVNDVVAPPGRGPHQVPVTNVPPIEGVSWIVQMDQRDLLVEPQLVHHADLEPALEGQVAQHRADVSGSSRNQDCLIVELRHKIPII